MLQAGLEFRDGFVDEDMFFAAQWVVGAEQIEGGLDALM
jgi:hypothetical protein